MFLGKFGKMRPLRTRPANDHVRDGSLRREIALEAMKCIMRNDSFAQPLQYLIDRHHISPTEAVSKMAFEHADAMIKEGNRVSEKDED